MDGYLRESGLLGVDRGAAAVARTRHGNGIRDVMGKGNMARQRSECKEHIDKETFKQIFRDHWEIFRAAHRRYDNEYFDEVIAKMLGCGDPKEMGYAQYRCCHCGEGRKIAFTCKSSFCLSCAYAYTDRWTDFIGDRLFPGVVYRHVVLTMPECLRLWFYRNPALLSKLMQCGHECLKDVLQTSKKANLDIGTVIVLHTSGRPGEYNPHLHILMTAGGIDVEKGCWASVGYLPYEILHRKWQFHLLSMLRREVGSAAQADIDHCWKTYRKGFVANIQKGEVPPGGEGLAQYLAKYLVSPPISVRRIVSYDGQSVRYWYRDHRTHGIEHLHLPVLQFIGRMVQHILPKGFQRIRYFGLHSNPRYRTMRRKLALITRPYAPLKDGEYRVKPRKSFVQLFLSTFGETPLLCRKCGEQMELERLWHPKHGTIRDFFEEEMREVIIHDSRRHTTQRQQPRGPTLRRPEQMVSLPLPFL